MPANVAVPISFSAVPDTTGPWRERAACRGTKTVDFFPRQGETYAAAKAVCARCPVSDECLAYSLTFPTILCGIWGGKSGRDRRMMLRGR